MTATSAPTWLLPQYVHMCAFGDAAVLLDLRTDCYHGLSQRQSAALSLIVRGWPRASESSGAEDVEAALELAHDLAGLGLLTQDNACGKSARVIVLPCVTEQLHIWDGPDWAVIRAVHWQRFAIAWARGTLELRLRPLANIVARVERRKTASVGCNDCDPVRTRELVHIFRALRPWFYTTFDRCLLDSLVLIEFLALHDQFPTWVIGVRTGPFAAHSWVQYDRYVLNGAPTFVRAFTPILAV